jgi:redox-sensitive bicupin YhaK (pirin superfamily)
MLTLRPHDERGHFDHGWLDSWHSFSFGDYHDPRHMGVSHLRVINDDRIAPGGGFPTHPHRDMEIITYVMEGRLAHRDSMGNEAFIEAGEIQRMSAGSGITHSEYNASDQDPVHLLQIWILPHSKGLKPSYSQTRIPPLVGDAEWTKLAAPEGEEAPLTIQQDARLFATRLEAGQPLNHQPDPGRHLYLHLARGEMVANGQHLGGGDGLTLRGEPLELSGRGKGGEALLFELIDHSEGGGRTVGR